MSMFTQKAVHKNLAALFKVAQIWKPNVFKWVNG